jgi:hypothetical protein
MPGKSVKILDAHRQVIATASVQDQEDRYVGTVTTEAMPGNLRSKFEEYEDLVTNQVFSLLDAIEEEIAATPFTAVFDNGSETAITDLQLYPKSGSITFKTTAAVVPALQP